LTLLGNSCAIIKKQTLERWQIMSIDFNSLLTVDERKAVVTQRVQQLAVEAYQLTLNLKVVNAQEEPSEQAITEITNNLNLLEQLIATYSEELTVLSEEASE
jgi:hypothetical protein